MSDDERLLELALSKLNATAQSAPESVLRPRESTALTSDLHLIEAIRDIQVPADEVRDARDRISTLLRAEIGTGETSSPAIEAIPQVSVKPTGTLARRRPSRIRRIARGALAMAAILVIGCIASWQVSAAASSALPGSPLYGIKRAEESLALTFAWSDERRGEVLATIADHRLSELRAEAQRHNNALVHSLAVDFDGTMRQLIALTATMTERHEDTTVVASDLEHELSAEYSTLHTAQQNGNVALAQALTVTTQSETTAISNSHISLPPNVTNAPTPGSGSPGSSTPSVPPATVGTNQGPPHAPPGPPPSPTPLPTPSPTGSSGGSGTGGQGGGTPGNGGGGHNGSIGPSGSPPLPPRPFGAGGPPDLGPRP